MVPERSHFSIPQPQLRAPSLSTRYRDPDPARCEVPLARSEDRAREIRSAQDRDCANFPRWSWTVIPDGEVTVNKNVHVCVPSVVYGRVVDLVMEAIAGATDVRVYSVSWLVTLRVGGYGKLFCLPPMLSQLLLVVSRDLLRGCVPGRKQQLASWRRHLKRWEV